MSEPAAQLPLDALSPRFVEHHHRLLGYLQGAAVLEHHALASGTAFDRGVLAQWAALHRLAITEAEMLDLLAYSPEERLFVASFAERLAELRLAHEAHVWALDFSK